MKISKKDKLRFSLELLIVLIIFLYGIAYFFSIWSKILENKNLSKDMDALYSESLKEEKELKSKLYKLNDDEYLAKYAREKYMYSKEGEIIIRIPED